MIISGLKAPKSTRKPKICKFCGKKFLVLRISDAFWAKRRCCNRKCENAYRKEMNKNGKGIKSTAQ